MPAIVADLSAIRIDSPLGQLTATASERGLRTLEFPRESIDPRAAMTGEESSNPHLRLLAEQLAAYFAGSREPFTVALDPVGTPFQHEVWAALVAIPHGQTRSYAEVARAINRPDAVRAVAAANGDNPIAILVPCHRVIGKDGTLTGYAGGLWRKELLLKLEGARLL